MARTSKKRQLEGQQRDERRRHKEEVAAVRSDHTFRATRLRALIDQLERLDSALEAADIHPISQATLLLHLERALAFVEGTTAALDLSKPAGTAAASPPAADRGPAAAAPAPATAATPDAATASALISCSAS